MRFLVLVYGVICYAIFFATFLYMVGFLGNLVVPRSIDSEPQTAFAMAALVNLGLVVLFSVQHTLMARPGFKKLLTRIVPEPAERSTYVLVSSVALLVLFWYWQPLGGTVWDVENSALRLVLYAVFFSGWGLILLSSFLINHFDLFGLRQVWLYFRGEPYTHGEFRTPMLYQHIRHPLYVGWFITFWATPTMTIGHLVFAMGMTMYILIAIQYEEDDLEQFLGERYAEYRRSVPLFVPRGKRFVAPRPSEES